jgi:hypothetical protein
MGAHTVLSHHGRGAAANFFDPTQCRMSAEQAAWHIPGLDPRPKGGDDVQALAVGTGLTVDSHACRLESACNIDQVRIDASRG